MQPRSLAFTSLIGSGCDEGLFKCRQGALRFLLNFSQIIGSECDQGLCKCSQGALHFLP